MDTSQPRLSSRWMLVAVVAVAGVLGACDDKPDTSTNVASIAAPTAAPAGSAATGTAAQRPQLRVDSSLDDEFRFEQAWYSCLKKNGAPMTVYGPDQIPEGITVRGRYLVPDKHAMSGQGEWRDDAQFAKAVKTCVNLEPLPAAAFSSAANPKFQDQYKAFITCLRGKGVKANPTAGDQPGALNHLSFEFADGADMPDGLSRMASQCEAQAFAS